MRTALLLLAAPLLLGAQAAPTVNPPTADQLIRDRKFDEVRAIAKAGFAKNKNDANSYYLMGRAAEAEGKSGEAVDWYEKAVKYDDNNAVYHMWLGSALGTEAQKASKLRQPFLARRVKAEFERSVQLDPKLVAPRNGLVDFYSIAPGFMGGSMEKARQQAAELTKLNALAGHYAMARIAQREKNVAAEEAAYKAALAAAPDSLQPYLSLGGFYRRQSRWDDAFAIFEQRLKNVPDDAITHAVWGFTAAQSGKNIERGERELKYFFANKPKDVSPITESAAHFRLGQIYERTARKELARTSYQEAIKLNPQNADAKKALDALK